MQFNIQEIVQHLKFNVKTLANDIALLFINGDITWDWPTVQAIQLNTQETAANNVCSISGWGKMAYGELSFNLYQAHVPIVSYQQCCNGTSFKPLTMICAGYISVGSVDAYKDDSGGPFVCYGMLTCIVSWGIGCVLPRKPGIYTNVSAFYEWIVKTNSGLNYTLYNSATDMNLSIYLNMLLATCLLYLLK